ncbi:MAG TPA: type III pantothenate kinase [Bacilli bacterium]|nr:type III pantothenate kinase [Bacilli bacterium]
MKLTVDVGNTTTSFGFFENNELKRVLTIDTDVKRTFDQFLVVVKNLLEHESFLMVQLEEAIISSVVPMETKKLSRFIYTIYGIDPLILGPGIKTGLLLKVDNPNEVGSDLVAVSVGALEFFKAPFLIVDLGTVNKYILIDEKKQFVGVSFTPGVMMSKDALDKNTALLMQVSLEKPLRVIGKNTKDALNSGLTYGTVAQIRGMSELINHEAGLQLPVIITGGNAIFIYEDLVKGKQNQYSYNNNLIHYGLNAILSKNKRNVI